MSSLIQKALRGFQRWFDAYPTQPLVYICSNNGVTGLVRAEDFDDEVRRMRTEFNKKRWPTTLWETADFVRPNVQPVFLFSDKEIEQRYVSGTLKVMHVVLDDCCVEERRFELPPFYKINWRPRSAAEVRSYLCTGEFLPG